MNEEAQHDPEAEARHAVEKRHFVAVVDSKMESERENKI